MFEPIEMGLVSRGTETGGEPLELSVVDAVLWACELSEDETEVGDLVEATLHRDDVLVRHVERSVDVAIETRSRSAE